MPSVEELEAALAEARAAKRREPAIAQQQRVIANSIRSEMPDDRYAATTWGTNEYDFTTPSGQTCRMRKLPIEDLAKRGILDKLTRLPGLTGELVKAAEGEPPTPDKMPSAETIEALTEVVNELLPIVVVQPQVHPLPAEGEERLAGLIYVDMVDFADRVAILNRSTAGLVEFDNFRKQS
jgi:hypothetical protein